jgi:ribosomal protein S21
MLIIEVKKGNIESALKQFKTKVIKTKMINELQDRKTYQKKSEDKREQLKNAIYKEQKRNLDY